MKNLVIVFFIFFRFFLFGQGCDLYSLKQDFISNPKLVESFSSNPELVDAWKILYDGGVDDFIRRNPDALETIDYYVKHIDGDKTKLTQSLTSATNKEEWFSLKLAEIRSQARNLPGTSSGNGVVIEGQWMRGTEGNIGLFPKRIADQLKGRTFNNFAEFRSEFWKAVGNDPDLSSQFILSNQNRMKNGLAPRVVENQQWGGRLSYEIHHKTPIHDGGGVYDIDNMVIVKPRYHKEVLDPAYHYNN